VTAAHLAAIPTAPAELAACQRARAFERLATARRVLAELANPHRVEPVDVDEVHDAMDARMDAYAVIGEWTPQSRTP
jgi:hypothetical protein